MSYDYENAYDETRKELLRLRNIIREQEQEIKDLRSDLNDMINDDPTIEGTINLNELGFMDCGENSWDYINSDDIDGVNGTEIWRDPKTDKYYEIECERVRHITQAKEVK